jgi:hypothetical protein
VYIGQYQWSIVTDSTGLAMIVLVRDMNDFKTTYEKEALAKVKWSYYASRYMYICVYICMSIRYNKWNVCLAHTWIKWHFEYKQLFWLIWMTSKRLMKKGHWRRWNIIFIHIYICMQAHLSVCKRVHIYILMTVVWLSPPLVFCNVWILYSHYHWYFCTYAFLAGLYGSV